LVLCLVCRSVLSCFFFSSRRRHTRFSRDWSSDVCSSDLPRLAKTREHTIELVMAEAVRFDRLDPALFARALGWGRGSIIVRHGEIGRASCRERGERPGGGGHLREEKRQGGEQGATALQRD